MYEPHVQLEQLPIFRKNPMIRDAIPMLIPHTKYCEGGCNKEPDQNAHPLLGHLFGLTFLIQVTHFNKSGYCLITSTELSISPSDTGGLLTRLLLENGLNIKSSYSFSNGHIRVLLALFQTPNK